jgi:hypothetical protein
LKGDGLDGAGQLNELTAMLPFQAAADVNIALGGGFELLEGGFDLFI